MAYVGFNDNGYDFYEKNNLLFSENNSHNLLFDYITKDLSRLSRLFERYISQRLEITTWELKDCRSNEDLLEIKDILISIHPYYEHEYKEVIINAIGKYFNRLLIYLHQTKIKKKWYIKILSHLMPSSFINSGVYPDGLYPDDFYHQYITRIDKRGYKKGEIEESVYFGEKNMPIGFSDEIEAQKMSYNMLYFILDISAKGIEILTVPQRMWLYNNIFQTQKYYSQSKLKSEYEMKIVRKTTFLSTTKYRNPNDINIAETENYKMSNLFESLYGLRTLDVGYDSIPTNLLTDFNSAIEYAKTIATTKAYEEYEITSINQLLYLEIMSMIQSNTIIKKCKNCGKYFVITNRNTAYCDRIYASGMRCSAIGSKRSFEKKKEDEPALKVYDRAYKTHYARYLKKKITWPEFESWSSEAKRKLEQVRAGELDISTYQEWLKI